LESRREPVALQNPSVALRDIWRNWFAAWEMVGFEYEEFIDAGDSVVSILSQRMRGRTSGAVLEWNSYAQVWSVRDGKIVRVEFSQLAPKPSKPWGCGGSSGSRLLCVIGGAAPRQWRGYERAARP
jgi:hypothetical protein